MHTRRLILAVTLSLLFSGLALWGFARVSRNSPNSIKLGASEFEVGSAKKFGASIDQRGPIFFPDLVVDDDLDRPLVLTHVAGNDFAALNALAPGSKELKCVVGFDRRTRLLVDPCTKVSYAADGLALSGKLTDPKLQRFLTEVTKGGVLRIDLNQVYPEKLRERTTTR